MRADSFFKIEVEEEKIIFLSYNVNDVKQIVDDCVNYFFNEESLY